MLHVNRRSYHISYQDDCNNKLSQLTGRREISYGARSGRAALPLHHKIQKEMAYQQLSFLFDFPAQIVRHHLQLLFETQLHSQYQQHLSICCLHCHVPANRTSFQSFARFVYRKYLSFIYLRDHCHQHLLLTQLLNHWLDQFRHGATSIGFNDTSLYLFKLNLVQNVVKVLARCQKEDWNWISQLQIELQLRATRLDSILKDMHTSSSELSQFWVVRGTERAHIGSTFFLCSVPSQDFMIEHDHYFRDVRVCGSPNGFDNVGGCITGHEGDRDLRASKSHSFVQPIEHKAESRSREGHSVSAMSNDESIVLIIILLDDLGQLNPEFRRSVGRVDGLLKLNSGKEGSISTN